MKGFSIVLICFGIFLTSASHAQVPVFPYIESFDSYTVNQPLNGDGGLMCSQHVYVTPYGIVGNCAEFQMSDTAVANTDTITSPLIGPLTIHTETSFYFRVVTFSGGVPSVYHMTYTDQALIYVGTNTFSAAVVQYTIDSTDQNTTTGYVKVTVPVPAILSGYSGRFRIIASNPSGNNWRLEFDSLEVRDTVSIPPVLRDSVWDVTCRGQSTGGIKVFPSGATAPYTYLWNTAAHDTTASISGQPAGIYTVTVTDHLGAAATITDTIAQPALTLILDSLTKTDAICYGSPSGSAAIYASGGNSPYQYSWSNKPPAHTDSVENLTPGTYTVTVTDAHNCSVTASVHISQPVNSLMTSTTSTQSTSGHNGTATVISTGGSGTISYAWSTSPVQTDSVATGLAGGRYEVTVTNGSCVIVDTVFVAFPAGISEIGGHHVSIYPNPSSDYIHIDVDGLSGPMSIAFVDMSGKSIFSEESSSKTIITSSLANGVYIIKIGTDEGLYMTRVVIER